MSSSIPFAARVSVPEGVLLQELEGKAVLLNVQTGRYFGLDCVGTRMWDVLTRAESIERAYKSLMAEYDVDEQELRSDLEKLVAELLDHSLLSLDETPNLGERHVNTDWTNS